MSTVVNIVLVCPFRTCLLSCTLYSLSHGLGWQFITPLRHWLRIRKQGTNAYRKQLCDSTGLLTGLNCDRLLSTWKAGGCPLIFLTSLHIRGRRRTQQGTRCHYRCMDSPLCLHRSPGSPVFDHLDSSSLVPTSRPVYRNWSPPAWNRWVGNDTRRFSRFYHWYS